MCQISRYGPVINNSPLCHSCQKRLSHLTHAQNNSFEMTYYLLLVGQRILRKVRAKGNYGMGDLAPQKDARFKKHPESEVTGIGVP